jgi:hypothetical protein
MALRNFDELLSLTPGGGKKTAMTVTGTGKDSVIDAVLEDWANDPDIRGGYNGQETAIWREWEHELGIEMGSYIDPFCNFTAVKDAMG